MSLLPKTDLDFGEKRVKATNQERTSWHPDGPHLAISMRLSSYDETEALASAVANPVLFLVFPTRPVSLLQNELPIQGGPGVPTRLEPEPKRSGG